MSSLALPAALLAALLGCMWVASRPRPFVTEWRDLWDDGWNRGLTYRSRAKAFAFVGAAVADLGYSAAWRVRDTRTGEVLIVVKRVRRRRGA